MIDNCKLVLDTFCEVHDLLKPWADAEFWDFQTHINSKNFIPGAVYLIGRREFTDNVAHIKQLVEDNVIKVIFSNPAEGADTMYWQCRMLGIYELVKQGKILIITGGYLPPSMPHLYYENFLPKILDYNENLAAIDQYKINSSSTRPYKFLFLNGRMRTHRKYLLERFKASGLLDKSLWTNLDPRTTSGFRYLEWYDHGNENSPQHSPDQEFAYDPFPVRRLPPEYEVDRYRSQSIVAPPNSNHDLQVKHHLFNNEWGDIYLESKPYLDTYFSLVTETTFDYQYTFRTEKIWKPVAMGHPWIAVANAGYYKDMHNAGFKTFGHVVDESFDSIENPLDRCTRIGRVVEDLCQQNLASFLEECYTVCKYNQQHLAEMRTKVRQEFPERFHQFINSHFNE